MTFEEWKVELLLSRMKFYPLNDILADWSKERNMVLDTVNAVLFNLGYSGYETVEKFLEKNKSTKDLMSRLS